MARTPNRFPVHGPDLRALLAACQANPDDDTPRLVLADWLQEHDDPRGELMRLQCQIAALPAGAPEYDDLFDRHQKWWKKHRKLWEKDVGSLLWDNGPHDRGLPTFGHYDEEYCWFNTDDVQDPTTKPKDRLSAAIADGWAGMTWVLPMALAEDYEWDDEDEWEDEFDDDEEEEELDGYDPETDTFSPAPATGTDDPFKPFREPPWAGSVTPIGISLPDGMAVTESVIDLAAKVPNVRGLSLAETRGGVELLPRIAKIKSLEHLDLGTIRLDDDGVKTLTPLKRLRTLIADGARFTNAGAATLAKFRELRELRIGTRRLSAAGLQALATLAKLEVLELEKADDAAVRHLSGLTRLRRLHLTGTSVTGRGLERFPLLTHLNLEATPFDDAGAAALAQLPRLQDLDLSSTRITGAALPHLTGLRWLSNLGLAQTAIGNRDVVHLEKLTNLELVTVWGSKVTTAEKNKLQKKLKNVSVI